MQVKNFSDHKVLLQLVEEAYDIYNKPGISELEKQVIRAVCRKQIKYIKKSSLAPQMCNEMLKQNNNTSTTTTTTTIAPTTSDTTTRRTTTTVPPTTANTTTRRITATATTTADTTRNFSERTFMPYANTRTNNSTDIASSGSAISGTLLFTIIPVAVILFILCAAGYGIQKYRNTGHRIPGEDIELQEGTGESSSSTILQKLSNHNGSIKDHYSKSIIQGTNQISNRITSIKTTNPHISIPLSWRLQRLCYGLAAMLCISKNSKGQYVIGSNHSGSSKEASNITTEEHTIDSLSLTQEGDKPCIVAIGNDQRQEEVSL